MTNETHQPVENDRPQPTTVYFRMPAELYDRLQLIRIKEHRGTMSAMILACCWERVEREND